MQKIDIASFKLEHHCQELADNMVRDLSHRLFDRIFYLDCQPLKCNKSCSHFHFFQHCEFVRQRPEQFALVRVMQTI